MNAARPHEAEAARSVMKLLLQRVSRASVTVNAQCVSEIQRGMLVFLGLDQGDDERIADRMLDRLLNYRMFADEQGRMNRSVVEVGGAVLLVSQFTLSANTRNGLRPSFSDAMGPQAAQALYRYLLAQLRGRHTAVAAGEFGADMQVSLVNDGPVTFLLES